LNLITASGHVYSFLLTEISNQPNAEPDLKLFVEPKEGSGIAVTSGLRVMSARVRPGVQKGLRNPPFPDRGSVRAAQAESAEQLNHFRSSYATKLQFDYPLDSKAGREPFLVSAIYHDHAFTYIKCSAREKPALYEIKDGKPNLISFQIENGVYIAPKIIDTGTSRWARRNCNLCVAFPRIGEPTMNQPTQPTHVLEKAPKPKAFCRRTSSPGYSSGWRFSWSQSCG